MSLLLLGNLLTQGFEPAYSEVIRIESVHPIEPWASYGGADRSAGC